MPNSSFNTIQKLPIPITRVILELEANYATTGDLLVHENQHVEQYQQLTKTLLYNTSAIAIHSPIAGVVTKIGLSPMLQPGVSHNQNSIAIEVINSDTLSCQENLRYSKLTTPTPATNLPKKDLLTILSEHGIVGLGGAGFPTAQKLSSKKINSIIINAVECESPIAVDNGLIINHAKDILNGVALLSSLLEPAEIIIALKESMIDAIEAIKSEIKTSCLPNIRLEVIANKYPNGYSKTLIKLITNQDIKPQQHSADLGVICLNVATIYSINYAVTHNLPLTERIVTISGNIKNPGNYCLPIGTPISTILEAFNIDLHQVSNSSHHLHVRIGGDYMGYDLINTANNNYLTSEQNNSNDSDNLNIVNYLSKISINKTTQALSINYYLREPKPQEHNQQDSGQYNLQHKKINPCIKCDYCSEVCPVNLLPQQLYWHSKNIDQNNNKEILAHFNLNNCIECGLCDAVCPSNLPLAAKFRFAKSLLKSDQASKTAANLAQIRSEWRNKRLEMQAAQKFKQAQEIIKSSKDNKQSLLSAALARAKNKKTQPATTQHLNDQAKQQTS